MKYNGKSRAELVSMGFVALSDETNLSLHSIVNLVGSEKVDVLLISALPLSSPINALVHNICDICGLEIEPVRPPRDVSELQRVGKTLARIAETVDGPDALYSVLSSQTAEAIADRDAGITLDAASISAAVSAYRAERVWQQALNELCGDSSDSAEERSDGNIIYFPGCDANNCPKQAVTIWNLILDDPDDELPF